MSDSTPRARAGSSKTTFASTTSNSPFLRQRTHVPEFPASQDSSSPTRASIGRDDPSGKGKAKAKWEVGTKGWVKEGFRKFGEHCARNQIRTLLIDCLVMTNLFYPSVAMWYQKRHPTRVQTSESNRAGPSRLGHLHGHEDPLSLLSTPLLDSFFPDQPSPFPPVFSRSIWDPDYETGWNATRLAPRRSTGGEEEVHLVRVSWTDVGHVTRQPSGRLKSNNPWRERDDRLLASIRDMVERWEGDHPGSREHCVRELAGSTDGDALAVSNGPCVDPWSVYHDPDGTAVDVIHGPFGYDEDSYHHAEFFMRIPHSSSKTFQNRWQDSLQGLAQKVDGAVLLGPSTRRSIVDPLSGAWRVSYAPESVDHNTDEDQASSGIKTNARQENRYAKYFILLYIAMFVILVSQVNFATRVHSKFGLAVTGIVQICCSAIMSLSVLALIGWNGWGWSSLPSSVPVWVLPMVIVIVGVENMSTLTKAVFSVPFHYSVPERIGLGLSRSGTKILFTSLTNILALALIWYLVDVVPVREFCLFAITVNITDWFMLHTFYLTVISIDAQRLELADVLATSGNQDPATQTVSTEEPDDARYILSWRGLLAGRMLKSGTLYLTLICVGVIYFLTGRGASSLSTPNDSFNFHPSHTALASISSPTPFITTSSELATLSHWDRLWRSVNPQGWPSIPIMVPSASVMVLPSTGHPTSPIDFVQMASSRHPFRLPRLKPLFYLFKVVILPQALTAGSLWMLLLYLLKDADLLDAQRDRLGRGEEIPLNTRHTGNTASLVSNAKVHMLPCGHASDIELVAISGSGDKIVTVGLDNSIALWRFGRRLGAGTREMLKFHSSIVDGNIIAVTVDDQGLFAAAAAENGIVQIWRLMPEDPPRALQPIQFEQRKKVIDIRFASGTDGTSDPFRSPSTSLDMQRAQHPPLTLVYADGSVSAITEPSTVVAVQEADTTKARAIPVVCDDDDEMAVVMSGDDSLRIRRSSADWSAVTLASHVAPGDRACAVSPLRQADVRTDLIAVGYRSGLIEIFDVQTGDRMSSIGQGQYLEPIRQVDLALPARSRCTGCGTSSTEGFTVVSTIGDQVYFDRVIPPSSTICRCSSGSRRSMDEAMTRPYPITSEATCGPSKSLVVPPNAARAKLSPSTSPRRSPSLLPPTSNGEFPLSSHGTRKLSAYQAHDGLATTPSSSNHDRLPNAMGLSAKSSMDMSGIGWSDMEVVPLGSVVAQSSKWTIVDGTVIGLRRESPGIGHEQWQLWTVDLRAPYNGTVLNVDTCSLASLDEESRIALSDNMSSDGDDVNTQQRNERLQSIAGRSTFPSIRGSFSVPTYPRLAYIDVRIMRTKGKEGVVAAFGNQLGVITLPIRRSLPIAAGQGNLGLGELGFTSPIARTPRSRLSSTSGLDKRPTSLGLTPPPPRRVSEDRRPS